MQQEEQKEDALDVTLTNPDELTNNQTPIGAPNNKINIEKKEKNIENKQNENINSNNQPNRQSMSPESKQKPRNSKNPFDDNENSIINNCAVLIIPLDNRVTPQMVANKFVKYGKILQVRPIKKSSTSIVIFSKASEASNCIRLFENHDKVRVTRPDQHDWNMCGEAIAAKSILGNTVSVEKVESARINDEKKAMDHKIANYETQQSRISIMYKQRHAYQMLFENDEIETRKRLKNNKLMLSRIKTMYKTSDELYLYLRTMIDLEIKHEENIHKTIEKTFGLTENGGSVHSAGIAIDALLKNRYEQFNDINDRVFKNILLSSQKYQAKLRTQMAYFQNRVKKYNDKIDESKTKLTREWNKYQNILNRTLKSQQLKTEGKNIPSQNTDGSGHNDPFLAGKSYALVQNEYKASLNEYNEEMSRLFNKVIIEDKKRIDGIKTILIDYFLAEKAKAVNHVKLIESSLEYIKSVDKESDSAEFIKRFGHIQQNITESELLSPDSKNIVIAKNNINEKKQDSKPEIKKTVSHPIITGAKLTQTPEGVLIRGASTSENISFNFSESETFIIHSKELKELIYTDVIKRGKLYRPGRIMSSNWKPIYGSLTKFGFFHAFENKNDIKPIISIYLNKTTIKIKDKNKKYKLFSFEIIVPNASWFSLTGTPTKYLYKVNNYDDCVSWIQNLKKFSN